MAMQPPLEELTDAGAMDVLTTFCRVQQDEAVVTQPGPRLLDVLRELLPSGSSSEEGVSKEDVARAAVEFLAVDADHGPAICAMAKGPRSERFGLIETATVVTGVLVVLQTHIRFERLPNREWSLRLEKKPTNPKLLSKLVGKLLSFVGE